MLQHYKIQLQICLDLDAKVEQINQIFEFLKSLTGKKP
jgi:hypothetical protein